MLASKIKGGYEMTWIFERLDEMIQWLVELDRPFAFLLAIPFMVALAGLAAEFMRRRSLSLPGRSSGEAG
jgi:hypothetical protein